MLILILVVLVIIYFGYHHYINANQTKESFNTAPITVGSIASGINQGVASATATVSSTPTTLNICNPKNWWEEKPVKAIRSKFWGASYNVIPITETGNITTPVLVPITGPNNKTPGGCISISGNGWHESVMCSTTTSNQQWIIKLINNQADFQLVLDASKNSDGTSGFTYGYKMDKVDYPFCMVISRDFPSNALYYNSSALGVKPVGNYDDQKWDILPENVEDPIATNKINFYTKLTPELQVAHSNINNGSSLSNLSNFGLQNNQDLMNMLQQILKTPSTTGTATPFKVNIEMDKDVLSGLTSQTIEEPFTNQTHNSLNPKKPIDISVTLGYNTQAYNGSSASGIKTASVTSPSYQLNANGELVQTNKNTAISSKCNESLCHPDMNEWSPKPYPCKGCIASSGEVWN